MAIAVGIHTNGGLMSNSGIFFDSFILGKLNELIGQKVGKLSLCNHENIYRKQQSIARGPNFLVNSQRQLQQFEITEFK